MQLLVYLIIIEYFVTLKKLKPLVVQRLYRTYAFMLKIRAQHILFLAWQHSKIKDGVMSKTTSDNIPIPVAKPPKKNISSYRYYNLKRSPDNFDKIKEIPNSNCHFETGNHKIIGGLPPELLAVFLLSQSNIDCELKFFSKGDSKTISLANVEKSGSKFSDILHGVELNNNLIEREMQLLSGQIVRAKGAPLKKSSVEILVKCYDAFREHFTSGNKEDMTLRKLIEIVNRGNGKHKADGKHNLRTLTQILLLSKVELFSSDNENIILPSQRLFTVYSYGADTTQALRDLYSEAIKKNETSEKLDGLNSKKGGKRTGRIMDICRKIFVNFSGSAFERVFNLHRVKTKKGIKAKGSYFQYNLDLDPTSARLAALLDFYKPFVLQIGEADYTIKWDKCFNLNSILAISGSEEEFKKMPSRFLQACEKVASIYGAIKVSKNNISILFNKTGSGQNVEDSGQSVENSGQSVENTPPISGQNVEDSGQSVENSGQSVETVKSLSTESKIKTSLVESNLSNLNTSNTSNKIFSTDKKSYEKIKEEFNNGISDDVAKFLVDLNPHIANKEKQRALKMGLEKYENEIRQTSGFYKFKKKLLSTQNSHAS